MRILITGGTGSLGHALARRWHTTHQLTIYSRDPHKQQRMGRSFPEVKFVLGDICNVALMTAACAEQDALVHAAALKIIGTGETERHEYLRVNVLGTIVVIGAWKAHHPGFEHAAFISTDKAVEPINHYGATKRLAEGFWTQVGGKTIRYGNIVTSNGTFLEVWRKMVAQGEPIVVRTPEPTRFYLGLDEAVDLIETVLRCSPGVYIPANTRAFSVWKVAEAMGAKKIRKEPLGPGEKQHEQLLGRDEWAINVLDEPLVRRVAKGWSSYRARFNYHSERTTRMTGEEFLQLVAERG